MTAIVLHVAFDSVDLEALWDILQIHENPARIVDLLPGIYSGTESAGGIYGCLLVQEWGKGVSLIYHFPILAGTKYLAQLLIEIVRKHKLATWRSLTLFLLMMLYFSWNHCRSCCWPSKCCRIRWSLWDLWSLRLGPGFNSSEILDDTVQSLCVCGKDMEATKSFVHHSSILYNNGKS